VNRYLKLVHMEVHRFRFILAGLMGLTAICQIGALIVLVTGELARVESQPPLDGRYIHSGISPNGKYSFAWVIFNTQAWFTIPILLSIAALVAYVFLIWYRDWVGRDTFIYRLLMLPTARRHIYLAKLTAVLLFVFGMVAFQLLLLPIENMIFNLMMPSEMREASYITDVISANRILELFLPIHFDQFLFSYGLGIIAVLSVFTAILFERSYRITGILYAILYLACCAATIILPAVVLGIDRSDAWFYPEEIFAIELALLGLVMVTSIWLGFRLLSKKITV
jgi:hypothetical protein